MVDVDSSGKMGRAHSTILNPVVYYKHDADPGADDSFPRAVSWLEFAASLHEPVTPLQ